MYRHIVAVCFLAINVCSLSVEAAAPPNILIILADDMGYGDLGCYGSKQIPTPNIDALAEGGIRCTQAYVSGAVCAPSRAGLMTGRYQERFGYEHNLSNNDNVIDEYEAVPRNEKFMPQYLKEGDYATGIIGKWHLGGRKYEWHHPLSRGFDYYFGRYGGHGYFPTVKKGNIWRGREPVKKIDVPYTTDWYTKEAIDFIDRTPEGQPWFMYLAHDTPHTPLQAKKEDIARFSHIQNRKRRIYAAMQHCLDENVGQLIEHLKATEQYENTLIVLLSDNGGPCPSNASINAPLWGMKGILYEGGVRVPMIFHWPAGLPKGETYTEPLISLDLLPTFLAAAGIERQSVENKKKPLDGVNLLPFLRGEQSGERPHDTLYWRIALKGAAIRDGDWKLLRLPFLPPLLFNLAEDISERNNLATQYPERVAQLLSKLNDWELTFERTPLLMEGVGWQRHSRGKYQSEFQITQPE